jgi:hypothetical protein
MARDKFYRQCTLERTEGKSKIRVVTWIPEEGAELGKTMRIKPHYSDKWNKGRYECVSVGKARKSESDVKKRMAADRKYIKNTDS